MSILFRHSASRLCLSALGLPLIRAVQVFYTTPPDVRGLDAAIVDCTASALLRSVGLGSSPGTSLSHLGMVRRLFALAVALATPITTASEMHLRRDVKHDLMP